MIVPPAATATPRTKFSYNSERRRAYFRDYHRKNKGHLNPRRVENRRLHKVRQRGYLESLGMWPIIPEERLYEIPPNLRVAVLSKIAKRVNRSEERRPNEGPEAQEIPYHDG